MTQDDLREYHRKHHPHAPLPSNFFVTLTEENDAEDEDDDGLGHYADGVKRTLTDDQIALFRHSEIEALLRKKRVQEEEREDYSSATPEQGTPQKEARAASEVTKATITDSAEPKSSEKRKRDFYYKAASPLGNGARPKPSKRRSQPRADDEMTYRRIARELDEVKAQEVELDY